MGLPMGPPCGPPSAIAATAEVIIATVRIVMRIFFMGITSLIIWVCWYAGHALPACCISLSESTGLSAGNVHGSPPDAQRITADSERNLEGFSPSPLFSVGLMGKMGWGEKKPSILEKRWTEDENRIIAWDRDLRHGGRICLSHVIWMGWHRYLACRVARFQSWFGRIFFFYWKMNPSLERIRHFPRTGLPWCLVVLRI